MTAGSTIVCGSCHDADSNTHGGGVTLGNGSNLVTNKIVAVYPNITCDTCHENRAALHSSAHSVEVGPNDLSFDPPGQPCSDCHVVVNWPEIEGIEHNVPTNGPDSCSTCHDSPRAEVRITITSGFPPIHCLDCHSDKDLTPHGNIDHVAFGYVIGGSTICMNCHDPGGAANATVAVTHNGNCSLCHTTVPDLQPGIPAGGGDCTTCHGNHFPNHTHHNGAENDVTYNVSVDTSQAAQLGCAVCHHDYDTANSTSLGLSTWVTILVEHDLDGTKDGSTNTCDNCHAYDGSGSAPLAAVQSAIASGNPATCATCHTDKVPDVDHNHGPDISGTDCESCHGHDNGYEYSPGLFSLGAGSFLSHSTHTEMDGEDRNGPGINCDTCHDISNFPYFKTGIDSSGDGNFDLSETDVCDTCHSPEGGFDGVNDATIGAKNNWAVGVYNGTDLKAGKEKWCAGCHDDSPSNSKADGSGVTARNIIGDYSNYGFYDTGHGVQLECSACHSLAKQHIDHIYNSVASIVEVPATPNPLDYRFFAQKGMHPFGGNADYEFQLCLSCHLDPRTNPSNFGEGNQHFNGNNHINIKCSFCHDVHGSISARMTRAVSVYDPGAGNSIGSGEFHIIRPGDSAANPGEDDTLYYSLTDRSKWNDPAFNKGGAIRTNPPCMNCHFGTAWDIANGLGPVDTGGGWYLRTYVPRTYSSDIDIDNDGIEDNTDNCPTVTNSLQENNDGDIFGNACDTCPDLFAYEQMDSDGDGFGDVCDTCPLIYNLVQTGPDTDGDGSPDVCDNCISIVNSDQADIDGDRVGDACDATCDLLDIDPDSVVQVGSAPSQYNDTEDWAWDIALDGSANVYVAGYSDGDFGNRSTPYKNAEDYFLMKFDNDGNGDGTRELLWTRQFGTTRQDKIRGVVVDRLGNAYVAGIDYNEGYYLYKYDTNGNSLWDPPIIVTNPAPDLLALYGGVTIDSNDMIYVTGSTTGDDLTIIKYDGSVYDSANTVHGGGSTSPTVQWTKVVNSTGNMQDIGMQAAADSQDFIYVVGHTTGVLTTDTSGYTNQGYYDVFLTKYDPTGIHIWTTHLGTDGYDYSSSVTVDASDNVYIGGKSNGSQFVARYDASSGHQVWYQEFMASASDFIGYRGLVTDNNGHLLVTGGTPGTFTEKIGLNDCFLISFDSQGNQMWARQFGAAGSSSFCRAIAIDTDGNPILTALSNGDFYTGTNQGTEDVILFETVNDAEGDGICGNAGN